MFQIKPQFLKKSDIDDVINDRFSDIFNDPAKAKKEIKSKIIIETKEEVDNLFESTISETNIKPKRDESLSLYVNDIQEIDNEQEVVINLEKVEEIKEEIDFSPIKKKENKESPTKVKSGYFDSAEIIWNYKTF
jgi:hypothetical protein